MANGDTFTTNGRKIMINRFAKTTPDYTVISKFGVGINNGTPSIASTALDYPVAITDTEAVDSCDDTAGWTASGTNSVTLNSTTYKEGTGALNLVKSDGSSATYSVSKTTTSRDFTSKTFFIWVYINATAYALLATTSCLVIRFGSDSSNYYYFNVDKASLTTTSWNLIRFTTATATGTTGSPSIAACDYTYVAIVTANATDTFIAGAVIMDDIKLASSDDFYKTIESGYPVINETTMEVEYKGVLTTIEANGNNINGLGFFNTDTTYKMASESTFTAESKSDTDQFTFITKVRLI